VDLATERKTERNTGVLHYVQDDGFKGKEYVQSDGFKRRRCLQDDGFKKEMNTSGRWLQKEKNRCFVVFLAG
jgi:hypothetical protein